MILTTPYSYLQKLLFSTILDYEPDVSIRLLEIAAHGNNASRSRALHLLYQHWPLVFGRCAINITSKIRPVLPLSSHFTFPVWIKNVRCMRCKSLISGYGLSCTGCDQVHLHADCFVDMADGACHSFVPSMEQKAAVFQNGHHFATINMVATAPCSLCHEPVWGVSVQASCCSQCGYIAHHECIEKALEGGNIRRTFALPRCRIRTPEAIIKGASTTIRLLQSSFDAKYAELLNCLAENGALSVLELGVALDILRVQRAQLELGCRRAVLLFEEQRVDVKTLPSILPVLYNTIATLEGRANETEIPTASFYAVESLHQLAIRMKVPVLNAEKWIHDWSITNVPSINSKPIEDVSAVELLDSAMDVATTEQLEAFLAEFSDDIDSGLADLNHGKDLE
jgi:hypothetical protein